MSRSAEAKAARKARDRAKAKERKAVKRALSTQAELSSLSIPNYITVVPFDSEEWKGLMEINSEAYAKIKGMAQGHVSSGDSPTEDWFANSGKTGQSIKDSIFSVIKNNAKDPRIVNIESKFASKFGDFKKLRWNSWAHVLFDMYKEPNWSPDETSMKFAIRKLKQEFGKRLYPLSGVEQAFDACPKHGNSGFPYFTKNWATNPEMVEYYMEEARDFLNGKAPTSPAALFCRRQPKGLGENDVKMRAVECPPKGDAIAGSMFLPPLYDAMREILPFIGYKGAANIGNSMQTALSLYEHAFEGDFSQFDSKVWTWWMEIIFLDILPYLFGNEYLPYFRACCEWYNVIEVVTPNGIVKGTHGLFSGCIWTNVIGTMVNYIATHYTMHRMGFDDTQFMNFSFGDDIAIFSEDKIDEDEFMEVMQEVGMDCNKSKQAQSSGDSRQISFLGFYHLRGLWERGEKYIGLFPIMRSLPSLVYRERYHDYDKDTAMALGCLTRPEFDSLRYLGKIENWRNHPIRNEAFTKLQEIGLVITPLSEETLNSELPSSKDNPNSPGVTRSSYGVSIKSFWTVLSGLVTTKKTNQIIEESVEGNCDADFHQRSWFEQQTIEHIPDPWLGDTDVKSNNIIRSLQCEDGEIFHNYEIPREYSSEFTGVRDRVSDANNIIRIESSEGGSRRNKEGGVNRLHSNCEFGYNYPPLLPNFLL